VINTTSNESGTFETYHNTTEITNKTHVEEHFEQVIIVKNESSSSHVHVENQESVHETTHETTHQETHYNEHNEEIIEETVVITHEVTECSAHNQTNTTHTHVETVHNTTNVN
jgi:hypothetical protein